MKRKIVLLCLIIVTSASAQLLPVLEPEAVGMDGSVLGRLDTVIANAIAENQTPGAVVLVSRKGSVVFRKAYGNSMLIPEKKEMTIDAVFDLASLTKPLATATSVMILIERGQIRLLDEKHLYPFRHNLAEQG